jgi:hypothetical protein
MVLFMSPGVPSESCQAAVTVARGPPPAGPGGRPGAAAGTGPPGPESNAGSRTAAARHRRLTPGSGPDHRR